MFVNYFASDSRATPINIAAVRVLLGTYVLWRVASIDARALVEWPMFVYPHYGFLYPPAGLRWILVVEKWLVLVAALAFLVGYRTRIAAFLIGLSLGHLSSAMMALNHSGETQQLAIACLLVLLFGLYAERDEIALDTLRETRTAAIDDLNDRLAGSIRGTYRMEPLKWGILALGILYAGGPWIRVVETGLLTWTAPESLARWTTYFHAILHVRPFFGELLVDNPLLLRASTWGTVLVESALIVAVLTRRSISPVVAALVGMHVMIFATMRIFFADMLFFLALFLAFDRGYARLVSEREIDLVYDERCFLCVRTLYLFKLLDINETVTFYSQSTAPADYGDRDGVDFEERMYVFAGDGAESHGGYWAFRELLRQFWITVPAAWLMGRAPVAVVGERVYEYVAANRSRHFVCSLEDAGGPPNTRRSD